MPSFQDTEAPTPAMRLEHRAAALVRAYRECSELDRLYIDRLVELLAWSKK